MTHLTFFISFLLYAFFNIKNIYSILDEVLMVDPMRSMGMEANAMQRHYKTEHE